MSVPKVSIIMPTYNRAYIISSAIDSVLKQTYGDWELLIVDDGSTDETEKLIKTIKDSRIKYFCQNNQGPAAARNRGLLLAKGEWVSYLDSDNEFLPAYLKTMLEWISEYPQTIFAIPRLNYTLELYEEGELLKAVDVTHKIPKKLDIKDIFYKTFHFDTNGLIHRKSIFDKGISWDEQVCGMEDWELALSIGEKYPDGFLYVPIVLANYHQRYGSDGLVSSHSYQEVADAFEQIYQKHKRDRMLVGQSWYPQKVKKWQNLQKEFENGNLPPYHKYYFQ